LSKPQPDFRELGCSECLHGQALGFDFSMAFQPIVNIRSRSVFAYEALARGLNGEGAGEVFKHVNRQNQYRFDQTCRTKAIALGAKLNIPCFLSINFMPNAVYRPELCIRTTLNAAATYGFPIERINFEFTESEQVTDTDHLKSIVDDYSERGFKTAIDDFGAGFAGLNLLCEIQTDMLKLDMQMIRGIDKDPVRQAVVRGVVQMCRDLRIEVIAEGVETRVELKALQGMGIELFQGYLFARPEFETLPEPDFSAV